MRTDYERERRKHPRRPVNIPAALLVKGQPYPCRIMNISEGGFFVKCDYFFSIGEKVFITAEDIPMIEEAGRTVRIDLSGIGGIFEKKETQ